MGLTTNRTFLKESSEALTAATGPASKDPALWAQFWPAYCEQTLTPFMKKWGALPLWDAELVDADPRWPTVMAIQSGRWGLIPVYPWTTGEEITRRATQIRRSIGKKHRDAENRRRGSVASWLTENGVSRREIAAHVWKRTRGLKRPSHAQAIARLSPEKEKELMHRFEGKYEYREAERRTVRAARGSEAPAVTAVRMSESRANKAGHQLADDLANPKEREPISFSLTMLLNAIREDKPEEVARWSVALRAALVAPPSA